jgi:hypothetical protein
MTEDREPQYPPMRAAGRGRAWYRGDCHVHTARSNGGELTPEEVAAAARASGLDFIAITEHNTADTHGAWGSLAGDDLLVILGQEVTTLTGHWLALGLEPGQVIESRYGVRDGVIGRHLDQVHKVGGLCVAAHPHAPYPRGVFAYPLDGFDLIEVWNGPWRPEQPWNTDNSAATAEWGRSLAARIIDNGGWIPAIGNSDTHLRGQMGVPYTVVLADELSTTAILAGIRAGRSWIAGWPGVELSLDVRAGNRSAGIGERLDTRGEPALLRAVISGVPEGSVTIHTDQGTVHSAQLPSDQPGVVEWRTSAAESLFVRVEVRHQNKQMAALTNPVILT